MSRIGLQGRPPVVVFLRTEQMVIELTRVDDDAAGDLAGITTLPGGHRRHQPRERSTARVDAWRVGDPPRVTTSAQPAGGCRDTSKAWARPGPGACCGPAPPVDLRASYPSLWRAPTWRQTASTTALAGWPGSLAACSPPIAAWQSPLPSRSVSASLGCRSGSTWRWRFCCTSLSPRRSRDRVGRSSSPRRPPTRHLRYGQPADHEELDPVNLIRRHEPACQPNNCRRPLTAVTRSLHTPRG